MHELRSRWICNSTFINITRSLCIALKCRTIESSYISLSFFRVLYKAIENNKYLQIQ